MLNTIFNNSFHLLFNELWIHDNNDMKKEPHTEMEEHMREKVALLMSMDNANTDVKATLKDKKNMSQVALLATSYFDKTNDIKIPKLSKEFASYEQLIDTIHKCTDCNLCQYKLESMPIDYGNKQAKWMIVSDIHYLNVQSQTRLFHSEVENLLKKILIAMGLSLEKDVYVTNVLKCGLKDDINLNPGAAEINSCNKYLQEQIKLINPKVIIGFGKISMQALLGFDNVFNEIRGKVHQLMQSKIIITYHLEYLLRNIGAKKLAWEDLQLAMKVFAES